MYCQCPNCETIFALSQDVLEVREGLVRCGSCREVFNASWYLLDELPHEATHAQTEGSPLEGDETEPSETMVDGHTPYYSPTPDNRVEQSSQPETDTTDSLVEDQNDSLSNGFDVPDQESEYEPTEQGLDPAELQRRLSRILDVDDEPLVDSDSAPQQRLADQFPDSEPDEEIVLDEISLPRTMQDHNLSFDKFLESESQSSNDGGHGSLEEALSATVNVSPPMPGINTTTSSLGEGKTSESQLEQLDPSGQTAERSHQIPDTDSANGPKNSSGNKQHIEHRAEQLKSISPTAAQTTVQSSQGGAGLRSNLRPPRKSSERTSKERDTHLSSTADDITLVEIPRLQPIRTAAWWLSSIFLVLLALFQLKQFYLVDLAQFAAIRPYLKTMCIYAGCEVPPRHEFALIELIDTRVNPHPDSPDALRVTASLISRARFEQVYPHVQVTLKDRVGRIVGRQTYSPEQYLGSSIKMLAPNVVEQITLDLANPDEAAVGYELELVSS
ncbi:zinc-ribbon and DUF3426 domain-containing protein [Pseudomonadota bacterium]